MDNTYLLGDSTLDHQRLATQTRLFSNYVRLNAKRLVGDEVHSILDLGCGEGQLGRVLREVYPAARLVGIDRDPAAIETARQQAASSGLHNIEYLVGNVEEELPAGPFDLIYASVIFIHTRRLAQVVELAQAALQPGGYLWVKEVHPKVSEPTSSAEYKELNTIILAALARLGNHPQAAAELLALLPQAGFDQVQHFEDEVYPLGGQHRSWAGSPGPGSRRLLQC